MPPYDQPTPGDRSMPMDAIPQDKWVKFREVDGALVMDEMPPLSLARRILGLPGRLFWRAVAASVRYVDWQQRLNGPRARIRTYLRALLVAILWAIPIAIVVGLTLAAKARANRPAAEDAAAPTHLASVPSSDEEAPVAKQSRYISAGAKAAAYLRTGGRCAHCDTNEGFLEFDHKLPHSLGGGNDADNIQLLCQPCNRRKGNRYVG